MRYNSLIYKAVQLTPAGTLYPERTKSSVKTRGVPNVCGYNLRKLNIYMKLNRQEIF